MAHQHVEVTNRAGVRLRITIGDDYFAVCMPDHTMEYSAYGRNGQHIGITGSISLYAESNTTPDYDKYKNIP